MDKKNISFFITLFIVPFVIATIAALLSNGYTPSGIYDNVVASIDDGKLTPFLVIASSLYAAQFFSGYVFNSSQALALKGIWRYLYVRISVLTYAIYEFLAFMMIFFGVLSTFIISEPIVEITTLPGTLILVLIFKSFIYTYFGIVLLGYLFKCLFKKWSFNGLIERKSSVGDFIINLQTNATHFLSALIIPTTLLGIMDKSVDNSEEIVFIMLSLTLLGSYCFLFYKSNVHQFFYKSFSITDNNE